MPSQVPPGTRDRFQWTLPGQIPVDVVSQVPVDFASQVPVDFASQVPVDVARSGSSGCYQVKFQWTLLSQVPVGVARSGSGGCSRSPPPGGGP